jgi:hypothetical protein
MPTTIHALQDEWHASQDTTEEASQDWKLAKLDKENLRNDQGEEGIQGTNVAMQSTGCSVPCTDALHVNSCLLCYVFLGIFLCPHDNPITIHRFELLLAEAVGKAGVDPCEQKLIHRVPPPGPGGPGQGHIAHHRLPPPS